MNIKAFTIYTFSFLLLTGYTIHANSTDISSNYHVCRMFKNSTYVTTDPAALAVHNAIETPLTDAATNLYIKWLNDGIKIRALLKHPDATEGLKYFVSGGVYGTPELNEPVMMHEVDGPCQGIGSPPRKARVSLSERIRRNTEQVQSRINGKLVEASENPEISSYINTLYGRFISEGVI